MNRLLWTLLGAGIAAIALGAVFLLIQPRETPEEIAQLVAQDWTSQQIDNISDAITRQATGGIPGLQQLAAGAISNQIRQRIGWQYSEAKRVSQNRYEVVATASAPIEVRVLVLAKKYVVSVDFRVTVNTENRTVDRWTLDLGSFKFQDA